MADIPAAARAHYRESLRLQALAVLAARRAWRRVDPQWISESWREQQNELLPIVTKAQVSAATAGASYSASTLAQQGTYSAPEAFVNPAAFSGQAPDGRPLDGLLYSPATTAKALIGQGIPVDAAIERAGKALVLIAATIVADTGRQAAGVDTMARQGVGYVRMVSGAACSRCLILAGRFYRWNAGFLRHPGCNCVHVPALTNRLEGAREEGLIDDPYEAFEGMSEAEQDRVFGQANAQAVRDGADIYQVVNSRRGISVNGLTTKEGTTRRGASFLSHRGDRLTPEGIYAQNLSREDTLRLLEHHGYVLPGGQQPGGVIRGNRDGYGALGRGGRRVGARDQIARDRASGIQSRYSMTEAQRRLHDSQLRWDAVRQGRNPYSNNGRGLTPAIATQVENDYRRWLATGGQIFTR